MWQQIYTPIGGSLLWSALVAALPVVALLYAIGVRRVSAWKSSVIGLVAALAVALIAYRMPPLLAFDAALYGAAFGAFPIFWIVFWAIVLYRITVETGKFEILKNSIGHLTTDASLQALLIAFAFGAFLEGAAGFGTPVAVAAAILGGLGFNAFQAAGVCLVANTAPVAFGSIAIPLVTLAATTSLPIDDLSRWVGRLCAPVSLFIPAYLVLILGGVKELKRVWPAALLCGASFAATQFLVSNFIGPYLTDILSALAAIVSLLLLLRFWRPAGVREVSSTYRLGEVVWAWMPYLLLVVFVLLWSADGIKSILNAANILVPWPGLHNVVVQTQPVVATTSKYAAIYRFRYLAEAGTSCGFATLASALVLRVGVRPYIRILGAAAIQLRWSFVSITAVLALAFVMNYSGATATLGLAFASTGIAFPFFSSMLGWLGVFLTGSDTSSNALFGNLQQITAHRLGLNPVLMAAANSAGGVMGKMISLQSIAVAAAAAGMKAEEEPRLFRFTIRHSLLLAGIVGLLALIFSYSSYAHRP